MEKKTGYFCQIMYVVLHVFFLPLYVLYAQTLGKKLSDAGMGTGIYFVPVILYLIVTVTFWFLNMSRALKADTSCENISLINSMLILKYGMVVYFIINFLTWSLLFLFISVGGMIATRGAGILMMPFVFAFVPVVMFFTFLSMVPGSLYGMRTAQMTGRCGKISRQAVVLHGILQFLFLLDVLDAMYLSVGKWKRGKKSAVLIGAIYILAVLLVIILGGKLIAAILKLIHR
jgi:hypothetical protein